MVFSALGGPLLVAQELPPGLDGVRQGPQAIQSIAIPGEPWGVASVMIPVGQIEPGIALRVLLTEEEGRAFYPSMVTEPLEISRIERRGDRDRRIGQGALLQRLKTAIQSGREAIQPNQGLRISFLFRGDKPLKIQLSGDVAQAMVLQPNPAPGTHAALMATWWKDYCQQTRDQLEASDYPPLVQSYLASMLAGRLNLPMPDLRDKKEQQQESSEGMSTLSLLAGTEALRAELLRQCMTQPTEPNTVLVPTPPRPAWVDSVPPPVPNDLAIESIAGHVPPECFYIRYGKFSNYLWFQQIGERRSGDLAQMATLRGFNFETNKRMERLLNTKTNSVAKLFGDSVISDMAIIGRDLYVQEGPSLGVLFESNNVGVLRASMNQDRVAAAARMKEEGVRLETIKIRDRDVTLLHSPDRSVRSFMVEHDKYLLLTSSQNIVERFLQVAEGEQSLAANPHFRFARLLLPVQNEYTLFAYFSPDFFKALVDPAYQIELKRRLTAIANIEIAEMAALAAKGEGVEATGIDELIAKGYLPKWFNDRPDGGRTLWDGKQWVDSQRGARGSFLPIADMEVLEATPSEVAEYAKQAQFYQKDWKQTDPLVVGIRRFESPGNADVERIALEAYVAPLGSEKYGWVSNFLAPPVKTYIRMPADDILNVQVHLAGSKNPRQPTPDHVLILGVKDMTPPLPGEMKGLIQTFRTLKQTPAYIGAWPLPGYLDRLPLGMGGGPPDRYGFSRLLIGLWRWQGNGFSLLSFDRSILENCAAQLAPIPAQDPAQARLKIGNLAGSKVSSWLNTFWYRRAIGTTRGNLQLLDAVQQQLHVPAEQARDVAEKLLDCRLECPLGGEYDRGGPSGKNHWRSTKLQELENVKTAVAPPGYQAPWLDWYRGGEVHLTQLADRLILIGQFEMQKMPAMEAKQEGGGDALPAMNFDLFNLPFKLFQGDKKEEPKEAEKERRPF